MNNLKTALARSKPSDLRGIKCGQESTTLDPIVEEGEDIVGKLLERALEKYLPTLAAALASAPAAGVVAFLTPTAIGSDSVEILNQSDTRSRAEVQAAARRMLQDTVPANFMRLDRRFMAKIAACAI